MGKGWKSSQVHNKGSLDCLEETRHKNTKGNLGECSGGIKEHSKERSYHFREYIINRLLVEMFTFLPKKVLQIILRQNDEYAFGPWIKYTYYTEAENMA